MVIRLLEISIDMDEPPSNPTIPVQPSLTHSPHPLPPTCTNPLNHPMPLPSFTTLLCGCDAVVDYGAEDNFRLIGDVGGGVAWSAILRLLLLCSLVSEIKFSRSF